MKEYASGDIEGLPNVKTSEKVRVWCKCVMLSVYCCSCLFVFVIATLVLAKGQCVH